jgi:hypothetical protein
MVQFHHAFRTEVVFSLLKNNDTDAPQGADAPQGTDMDPHFLQPGEDMAPSHLSTQPPEPQVGTSDPTAVLWGNEAIYPTMNNTYIYA